MGGIASQEYPPVAKVLRYLCRHTPAICVHYLEGSVVAYRAPYPLLRLLICYLLSFFAGMHVDPSVVDVVGDKKSGSLGPVSPVE